VGSKPAAGLYFVDIELAFTNFYLEIGYAAVYLPPVLMAEKALGHVNT